MTQLAGTTTNVATPRAQASLAAALGGDGHVIALTGEAGIGKTHLARALFREARTSGAAAVWARAGRVGAPPFWPWVEALRQLLPDVDLEARPRIAALLAGDLHSEPADLRSRFLLFEDVAAALLERAADRRILIVLDDLHEADAASLLLTAHVGQSLTGSSVGVLVTVRDDMTPAQPEWSSTWGELVRTADVIPVQPLDQHTVAALMAEVSGVAPAAATVARVLDRTGGNALFVRELTSLDATGETDALPESVVSVVTARLARLSAECRRTLAAASVLGPVAPHPVLASTLAAPTTDLLRWLAEAADHGLISRGDPRSVRFSHGIVRDAVYEGLSLDERAAWHGAAARVLLERDSPRAVDVAEHLTKAGPADAREAATWWSKAGDDAMAVLGYEEATRCYRHCLDLGAADEASVLLRLGDACLASGDATGARAAFLAAVAIGRRTDDAVVVSHGALGLGSGAAGFEVALLDREQIDALTDALRMLPDEPLLRALRARVMARLSVALTFASTDARRAELASDAMRLAEEAGDHAALAVALCSHCDVISGPEHVRDRLALTTRIIELAQSVGDSTVELVGLRMRIVARLELGDLSGFADDARSFGAIARALRQPLYLWYVPLWQATMALYEQRYDDCSALLEDAATLGDAAGSVNATLALVPTLQWCLAVETSRELLVQLEQKLEEVGLEAPWVPFMRALLAGQLGDVTRARTLFDIAAPGLESLPRDGNWLATMCQNAETLGIIGSHPAASWIYDQLLPHADVFAVEGIAAGLRGSVHRHLALAARAMGRADLAAGHFEHALAANESLGLPLLVARTRADQGSAAVDRPTDVSREPTTAAAVFRRAGDVWSVSWQGTYVALRDSKGLQDLARLLAEPGRPFAAVDLAGSDGRVEQSDLGDVLDAEARAAYRRRLTELDEEASEADDRGDAQASARIATERDALIAQLTSAYGLAGRPRRAGSTVERARTTVTARIREALKRIEAAHPALGRHLRASVKTGTVCVYEPPEPVTWAITA